MNTLVKMVLLEKIQAVHSVPKLTPVIHLHPKLLIFFGPPRRCTHVGLHLGGGVYRHSSGIEHGRNGIGVDSLHPSNTHPVAGHYRNQLRGAGRVVRCHDGSHLN